ncbi:MAG: hypothetical protein JWN14_36 [Chthonomonadales bacterium]|nr:hypothetical protein [Chthonomonadales bacterium]
MSSRTFQNEAQRRVAVSIDAWERHPDSPLLVSMLIAWSDAEAAINAPGLRREDRHQAEQTARARMDEYLRVKALPILFPYCVVTQQDCK